MFKEAEENGHKNIETVSIARDLKDSHKDSFARQKKLARVVRCADKLKNYKNNL